MARWSNNSGWNSFGAGGGVGGLSTKTIAGVVAFTLVIGLGLGYLLASASARSGPTQTVEGSGDQNVPVVVPTDYNKVVDVVRSEEGASRAATSFVTSTFNLSLLEASKREAELNKLLAPDVDPQTRSQLETELSNVRFGLLGPPQNERPLSSKVLMMPGSYRVQDISPQGSERLSRVRVVVWLQTVSVDSQRQDAVSFWTTNTVELSWSDHWRVASFSRKAGPSPVVASQDGQFSSYQDVISVFNQFKSYRYATQD